MATFLVPGFGGDDTAGSGGGGDGGVVGVGPIYYGNDNPKDGAFDSSDWPTLMARLVDLNRVGGRELLSWSHNATTGAISNPNQHDNLLQAYKDAGRTFMLRVMPADCASWTETRVKTYVGQILQYIYSSEFADTVKYILGINEPDGYNRATLFNLQKWYYEGAIDAVPDAPVVLSPLTAVQAAPTNEMFVTRKWHQYCKFAGIHAYDGAYSPTTGTGAANTAWIGLIHNVMAASGIVKPLVMDEWGAGSDQASGNCTPLQWKAACHVQGFISIAQIGAVASSEYSVQASHSHSGSHNLVNTVAQIAPSESLGNRQPAYWAVKWLGDPQRYLFADFGGLDDIRSDDDIPFSTDSVPSGHWRMVYPYFVTFYSRGQPGTSTKWFVEWDAVTPTPGNIHVTPILPRETLIRRYVTGLVIGATYRMTVSATIVEATRDGTHFCRVGVQGHKGAEVLLEAIETTKSIEFVAENPWTVCLLQSKGLTVDWTQHRIEKISGGVVDPPPPPEDDVGVFAGIAIVNGNTDEAPNRAAYLESVRVRLLGRALGTREGWVPSVAHPNAVPVPTWLSETAATMAAAGRFVHAPCYPAQVPGLPGTWGSAAPGSAAYTAATAALSTWSAESYAASKSRHAEFLRNWKWNCYKKLTLVPQILLVEDQNEPSNSTAIITDFPAGLRGTANGVKLQRMRFALIADAAAEVKEGVGMPSGSSAVTRPWMFGGPVLPEQRMSMAGYGLDDVNAAFGALYQKRCHVVTGHKHRLFSDLTRFDDSEPEQNYNTLYNMWLYQRRAVAINGGPMKAILNTEAGQFWQSGVNGATDYNNKHGTWNGGTVVQAGGTNARGTFIDLKSHGSKHLEYESHMPLIYHLWYGISGHVMYSNAFSHFLALNHCAGTATPVDPDDGLSYKRSPHFEHMWQVQESTRYDSRTWGTTFPVKDWTTFHDLWTWGVFINDRKAPTSVPLVEPPYDPWLYTFFGTDGVPAGQVEMRPWTLTGFAKTTTDRSVIAKPVWLAYPNRPHTFRVKVNFPDATTTAATRVKIRVRGYNKLAGDVGLSVMVVGGNASPGGGTGPDNWKQLEITFSLTGHGLAGYPPINAALCVLDYENAAGAKKVRFKDPQIVW